VAVSMAFSAILSATSATSIPTAETLSASAPTTIPRPGGTASSASECVENSEALALKRALTLLVLASGFTACNDCSSA
jgi:hypothetical protein